MAHSASYFIENLDLMPHPEGGFFKEVYRSKGIIPKAALPSLFDADRNYATGIYYLLAGEDFSTFHRIQQDETWHFYSGDPLYIHMIEPGGQLTSVILGLNISNDEKPQITVPAKTWFAASLVSKKGYCLAGCTVAPGFDFADFEIARRSDLTSTFPDLMGVILEHTRE